MAEPRKTFALYPGQIGALTRLVRQEIIVERERWRMIERRAEKDHRTLTRGEVQEIAHAKESEEYLAGLLRDLLP